MATLKSARTAQYPQFAEFKFTMADNMLNASGVLTGFNATTGIFDAIPLPAGAVVVGGDVTVETASDDTGTATIAVGDSVNNARYLAATSIKAAARTALTLSGFRSIGNKLRLTLANANGNAANGVVTVRVEYVLAGRVHETAIV